MMPKVSKVYNASSDYNFYRFTNINYNLGPKIEHRRFQTINSSFNKFIRRKVLEGHICYLPFGLGALWIRGHKGIPKYDRDGVLRGLPIDWGATKKLRDSDPEAAAQKKLVYCLNKNTDGIIYKIAWKKRNVWIRNQELYYFKPCVAFKRELHNIIEAGDATTRYPISDHERKLSHTDYRYYKENDVKCET